MNNKFEKNDIIHTKDILKDLNKFFNSFSYSKIYLLTDNNCFEKCLPIIKNALPIDVTIFVLSEGEENKSIIALQTIWDFLIENKADRASLLINLGGGIITDIGGFAASTFKRGIDFVNIPTTLLAQIDASVGGKTGINYKGFKNEIGVINQAKKVFVFSDFLKTLEKKEFLSGFAEMIKHALIFNKANFQEIKDFYYNYFIDENLSAITKLVEKSVRIKQHFVENDINDKGIRQTLNFGHTFGHAFESLFYKDKQKKLKHGNAVAFGMLCELFISAEKLNFDEESLKSISKFIIDIYGKLNINTNDYDAVFEFMKHDKKNTNGKINTVLLEDIGKFNNNNILQKHDVFSALNFLNNQ